MSVNEEDGFLIVTVLDIRLETYQYFDGYIWRNVTYGDNRKGKDVGNVI